MAVKDHEKAELVNRLRDIAIEFHATQQLRARIAEVVLPALERVERDMTHEAGAAIAQVVQNITQPRPTIDWGEVDDELRAIVRRAFASASSIGYTASAQELVICDMRALLGKVSGQ